MSHGQWPVEAEIVKNSRWLLPNGDAPTCMPATSDHHCGNLIAENCNEGDHFSGCLDCLGICEYSSLGLHRAVKMIGRAFLNE